MQPRTAELTIFSKFFSDKYPWANHTKPNGMEQLKSNGIIYENEPAGFILLKHGQTSSPLEYENSLQLTYQIVRRDFKMKGMFQCETTRTWTYRFHKLLCYIN